jgi:hypothetical protein
MDELLFSFILASLAVALALYSNLEGYRNWNSQSAAVKFWLGTIVFGVIVLLFAGIVLIIV